VVDPLQRFTRRIGLLRAPEGVRGGRVWGSPGLQGRAGLAADCLPRATGARPKSCAGWGKACPIDGVARGSSPPPSAALATCKQAPALEGSADRAARSPVKMCARAPRDLGAVFPDGCPVRAARHRCRASSLGVVQRTPLHRGSRGVHSRPDVSALPSGRGDQPRPRSALVVSHHLDGLLLLDRAGLLHPAADPGVHRVAAVPSCPPKLCSPPAARARVTARIVADACVHRAPLPSWPSPLRPAATVTRRVSRRAGPPGPCSAVGSGTRASVAGDTSP
jgi:hypothetical protein